VDLVICITTMCHGVDRRTGDLEKLTYSAVDTGGRRELGGEDDTRRLTTSPLSGPALGASWCTMKDLGM
jgi:hypothetical protein